jgi:hypothetical protein
VVFVRRRTVEVPYLRARIREEQCRDFESLVKEMVNRLESGMFPPWGGIQFPQNRCTSFVLL